MKYLDRGTLVLLVAVVAFVAYVESRGGFRAFTASRTPERRASISPQGYGGPDDHASPSPVAPSFPEPDGMALFANPIAAAEGAEGTMIAPMSATAGGAVKITPAQIASPEYADRLFRDPDKGTLFVALPTGVGKSSPKPHGDDASAMPTTSGYGFPDVMAYYRSRLAPKAQPRAFPVSM